MPKQNIPQLNTTLNVVNSGQIRPFVQFFPSPLENSEYYGRMNMTDNFGQTRTESDVTEVPSDLVRNEWVKIGEIVRSLERGSTSFTQLADQDLSTAWDQLLVNNTRFNLHLLVGDSSAPQDFAQWRSAFLLANCRITELTRGENANPQTADDNANLVLNGSFNFWDMYPIGSVKLIDLGGSTVTKDMNDVDITYRNNRRYSEIFGITTNDSGSTPSAVVYVRTDDATTVSQTDITALSTDGEVTACAVVGENFIALQNDGTLAHIYSSLADIRAGNDNFTSVSGYTASSGGNALYAANSANIFIAADGGYIYKLSSVSSAPTTLSAGGVTTENLTAIDGVGSQILVAGANSAMVVSNDFGSTWASVTAPDTGLTLNTVAVFKKDEWLVGDDSGDVHYTDDGGVTWTTLTLEGSPSSITSIKLYGRNTEKYFGFILANDGSNVFLYRTINSGAFWSKDTPFVVNVNSVFDSVTAGTGLAVLDQNEIAVVGSTVLGHGIA